METTIPKKVLKLGPAEAVFEQVNKAHASFQIIHNAVFSDEVREQDNPVVIRIKASTKEWFENMSRLLEWAENNYLMERDSINAEESDQVKKLCNEINNGVKAIYRDYMSCATGKSQAFSFILYLKHDFRAVFSALSRTVSFVSSVESYA